jgi:hypothetical protein
VFAFGQQNDELFGVLFNDPSDPSFGQNFLHPESLSGSMAALFLEDEFRVSSWLTLNAGIRQTHFSGSITENATSPRFGAAVRVPKLNWVFRGFYGRFYQAPPLLTASGPLLQFVSSQNLGFIPLHGERDEESQFGVAIPYKGWILDADTFRTRSQQRGKFGHFLSADDRWSIDTGLGTDLALATYREARRTLRNVFESDRARAGRDQWRADGF